MTRGVAPAPICPCPHVTVSQRPKIKLHIGLIPSAMGPVSFGTLVVSGSAAAQCARLWDLSLLTSTEPEPSLPSSGLPCVQPNESGPQHPMDASHTVQEEEAKGSVGSVGQGQATCSVRLGLRK